MFLSLMSTVELASSEVALPSIRIRSDGSIDPANVPIRREGDLYTFAGDIYATMVIEKDNVVIDGAGYALQGTYNGTRTDTWQVGQGPNQELSNATLWTIGIDFDVEKKPNNVTVRNLNIRNFYIGIYVWTSSNTLVGSAVTDNIVGILLSGDYNTITGNHIARNNQGIFFGVNKPGNEPLNIVLTHNSFIDNSVHFSGCFCEDYNTEEAVHTWDDGKRGNYWSDYNGTDADGDGIGDVPYVIDVLNQDRYPLMQSAVTPPTPRMPVETIILAAAVVAIVAVAVVTTRKRRNKNRTQNTT
jgi:nitrous oxidase accessory protein NosD